MYFQEGTGCVRCGRVCCGAVRDGAAEDGDGDARVWFWGRCMYLLCVTWARRVRGDVREGRRAVHRPTSENTGWFGGNLLICL